MSRVKIASASYPLNWFEDFTEYEKKLTKWVEDAADCDLLVFPEYGSMELASLGGRQVAQDLEASLHEVARHEQAREKLHCELAKRFNLHILMASGPVFEGARPTNRAVLIGPEGPIGYQDKQIMTRFEREEWHVIGAPGLKVFDTKIGRIGILICYDSEFPLLGRTLAEAGAQIILVPSCTDTISGYNRVKIGSMARALESQSIVVQSPIVGNVDWCPAVDENCGAAGIYCPPDGLWPETGILASGELNSPGWVKAEFELKKVEESRTNGRVLTFAHWPESQVCQLVE